MENETREILKADIKSASTQHEHPLAFESPIEKICYFTSYDLDLGQANFLNESESIENDILNLRLLVLNGDFSNAKKILRNCNKHSGIEEQAEYCLSEAQLLGHENNWLEVLAVTESGLRLNPSHITKISLLQCRAMALYELKSFNQALIDCEMVLSQEELYPSAVPVRYSFFLKQKIFLAKSQSLPVKETLKKFWRQFVISDSVNLDFLLSLIRLQIDFNRSQKLPIRDCALFSYFIASKLSDSLYQSLALIDWYSSLPACPKPILNFIKSSCEPFKKSQVFINELDNNYSSTTSSERLQLTIKEEPLNADFIMPQARFVMISEYGIVVDMEKKRVIKLSNSIDWKLFSETFKDGPVHRKEFFRALWQQRYAYQKHDGVIRSFIFRLKKRTGIQIVSENSLLSLQDTFLI